MEIFRFLLVFSLLIATNCMKLNYPRVLLPIFDKISVNFTLEVVEKGCFKWTSSRMDLIHINPMYEEADVDCSYRVMVRVINKEKRRNTAIVLAEDLSTGNILRCDIILDVIDQLEVLTTTRELYLEEAPETFELLAKDAQGNYFSTLEGVQFEWKVQSHRSASDGKDGAWREVLKFLPFAESTYHVIPKTIETLEQQGLTGYMILLEGINTGSARVTVKLPYSEYIDVPPVEVNIMVLANLILKPSDVHILAGDQINFQILQLKQGKFHDITMNNQYYLEIEHPTLAKIEGNEATGLKLGRTFVHLRDRNVPHHSEIVPEDFAMRAILPKASLTVADPMKMMINLLPHLNWFTVVGEKHTITIDLFTQDNHKIILGPNYQIQSQLNEKLFAPNEKTSNGSRIYGDCINIGSTPVLGLFENLNANAEMVIFEKIEVQPAEVIIPYDTNMKRQKIQFKATGGDGQFTWSSLHPMLITIAQTGVAETKLDTIKTGIVFNNEEISKSANIKVAMMKNPKISAMASILFLPPVKLEIVSYNFETVVQDYVTVHVALHANDNGALKTFTACDNLNFDLELSQQIFVLDTQTQKNEILLNGACRLYRLKATNLGSTKLKITYRYFDRIFTDAVTLHVFEGLNILNPAENEIVLPIGSSRNVIYYNGPRRIFNSEAELQKKVSFEARNLNVAEVVNNFSADKHIFNILCRKIGDFMVKFDIFNNLNTKNFVPYVSSFETKVFCVKPRFLNLYTTAKMKESCPIKRKNSLVHMQASNENLEIDVEVLDVNNRKLMNITSLTLEWHFTQSEEKHPVTYKQLSEEDVIENIPIPKRDFIITSITDVNVNFKIRGYVTQYNLDVLKKERIAPESPHFGIQKAEGEPLTTPIIENELSFLSVNRTLLPYDMLRLYLSKSDVHRIQVAQGSGFYDIHTTDNSIADVIFDEAVRHLIVSPKKVGDVTVTITDKCLSTESSYLYVSVVTIGRITIMAQDRVQKQKTIEAIVRLYDNNDHLINVDNKQLHIYDLDYEVFDPNVLTVALGHQNNLQEGEIRLVVTGSNLGETKITARSGKGDELIKSPPAQIQVFSPLLLQPRNATIIVGSSLQIFSSGGPSPDSNVVFNVEYHDIVSIDAGLAFGLKIGESKIIGRCVGISALTGQQVIYSEDTVIIHVIPLSAIEIKVPLTKIKTGATMPGHIFGMPNISPMILGTLDSVKIYWSTENPDVIDIKTPFHDAGIEYSEKDAISVRLTALTPGKAQIHVVLVTGNGQKLTTKTEITVFKILELESPKVIKFDSILIPPRAHIQLKTNLDDTIYEIDKIVGNPVVKVTPNGLVQSNDAIGRNQIIAKSQEQTLAIPIEVKPVHYILTTLESASVKLKSVERHIPQGFGMRLIVSLHDNLGNTFSHSIDDINSLKYQLANKDNVQMQAGNFAVDLSFAKETSNMLAISLRDAAGVKYSHDYLKLSVVESLNIFPSKVAFSVGDVVCFESPLTSGISNARWSSSDPNVISIDPESGVANILSLARGRQEIDEKLFIHHGEQGGENIKFAIEIKEADEIEFLKNYDIFVGEKYVSHLIIKNHQQIDKVSNLVAKNSSSCAGLITRSMANFFSCKLTSKQNPNHVILNKFKVSSIFDKSSGRYACEIVANVPMSEIVQILKKSEVSVELEARLVNGISDWATLKLVPSINLQPDFIQIEQIDSQILTVTGLDSILQKIVIVPSNAQILEVLTGEKLPGSKMYKFKLSSYFDPDGIEDLYVTVNSPLTQQSIKIPFVSANSMRKCSVQPIFSPSTSTFVNFVSNLGLIISALVVLAATVWVFVFCFPPKSQTSQLVNTSPFLSRNNSSTPTSPSSQFSSFSSSQGNRSSMPMSNSMRFNSSTEEPLVYGDSPILSPKGRQTMRF